MRLLRSWTSKIPAGRNYVVDATEKLLIEDYDYAPLADVGDDVVLLEWDIAVDRDELAGFIDRAKQDPERVIVAPYRLYVTTERSHPRKPVWVHRRADGSHVDFGDPSCAFFGFGLTYFPQALVTAFRAAWPGHFSDTSFSGWHHKNVGEAPILWDVHAAHLHYDVADLGLGSAPSSLPLEWVQMVSRQTDPAADDIAAERASNPVVAALLRERASLSRRCKWERIGAVNIELARHGYTEG